MNAMGQPEPAREKNDDLDLLLILKGAIVFLKTNTWKLLGASLAGLLVGVTLYLTLPKKYTSRVLLESTLLVNTDNKAIIENWDLMLKPTGYPYLMKEFDCDKKTVQNLLNVALESLSQQTETGTSFAINVTVWDTTQLPRLQTALVRGLTQGEYVRQQVEVRKATLQQQLDKVLMELQKLDSPREFIGSVTNSVKKEGEPLILDISNFSVQRTALVEKEAGLRQKLAFNEAIYVLADFSATKGPKPGMMTLLGIGLIGGFLIGYFFVLAAALNRKMARL
jgi:hypothetical protein